MIARFAGLALLLAAAPARADPWSEACAAFHRLSGSPAPAAAAPLRIAALAGHGALGGASGFAGALLVDEAGRLRLARGYGAADAEGRRPMTPDTVFDIGSVSKQFTAAAVMALAERGRLRPEDPIARFLPDVPPDKAAITIHQLLTHSAGFPGDVEAVRGAETKAGAVAAALAAPLARAPGSGYRYSNTGYVLLAAIIEAAAGEAYERVLARLWRRAGLRDTGWARARRPGFRAADGRTIAGIQATPDPAIWRGDGPNWGRRGPGALLSTPADLRRWALALRQGRVLSDRSVRQLIWPHVREPGERPSFYGYGWTISAAPDGSCKIWHDGSNSRHFNVLTILPGRRAVTHAVSLEARSPVSAAVLAGFEPVLFGAAPSPLPERRPTGRGDVARLAGRWIDADGAAVMLRPAGDRVLIRATAPDAARMFGGFPPLPEADARAIAAARTALPAILDGIGRGDPAPLFAHVPTEIAPAEEAGYWRGQQARWAADYGAFAGGEVIATTSRAQDAPVSHALLHFAGRSIPLTARYDPAGGLFIGTSIAAGPETDLLPLDWVVSRDAAGLYRVDNLPLGTSVRLLLSADGRELTVECPRGRHVLRRAGAAQPNGAFSRTTSQLSAAAIATQTR